LAALQIAERIGDIDYQLRALWGIWIGHHTGESQAKALEVARKFREVATRSSDVADPIVGDRIVGTVLWAQGELQAARSTMERVLRFYVPPSDRSHLIRFQFDQRVTAYSALSLTLWLQGFPEQAMRAIDSSVRLAQDLAHDPSIFHATALSGCRLALLAGDRSSAETLLALLQGAVARQVSYGVWIRAYRGEILIRDGDAAAGSRLLEVALTELPKSAFHAHYASLRASLAQGYAAAGRLDDAMAVIENALELTERSGDLWYFPELLRVKGEFLAARRLSEGAEETFLLSLDWARRQGALAWELRAGTSLARLWLEHGKVSAAQAMLSESRARFTEGFETVDLIEATRLLRHLGDDRRDIDEIQTDQRARRELL
jgi:tetratricopeptide (TPR) repeat protein